MSFFRSLGGLFLYAYIEVYSIGASPSGLIDMNRVFGDHDDRLVLTHSTHYACCISIIYSIACQRGKRSRVIYCVVQLLYNLPP